jgi:exosortase
MSTTTISADSKFGESDEPGSGRWSIFWLMLGLAVAPMLVPYFTNLWTREPYRFFPLALLAVGYLWHRRWDRQFRAPYGLVGWTAVAIGIALTAFGILIASPWICAVACLLIVGCLFYSSTDQSGRPLFSLVLPLMMVINLPLGYDQLLTIRLQQATTALASVALDLLAVPHAVSNNVIQLTTRELFVAEACSGIQSVFTLMFLATLLVAVYRRPIWTAPLYLVIAALLAVAANVLRVTVVAVGDVWLSLDLADGWRHELVGYTALLLGTLLLLSFDQLIMSLLHPVDPVVDGENNLIITTWNFFVGGSDREYSEGASPIGRYSREHLPQVSRLWQALGSRRVMAGLLSILCVSAIAQAVNLQRPVPVFISPTEVLYQPDPGVFEREFASMQVRQHDQSRGGSNPRLGENADIWTFKPHHVDAEIQVVLSQPYAGWHELCICYEINAWILLTREVRGGTDEEMTEADRGNVPYAFARFKNPDGRYAYLVYTGIDAEGNVVSPPPRPGRLGNRFIEYFGESGRTTSSNVMMLQMFIVANEKLEADSLRELTSDFVQMRSILQAGVRGGSPESVEVTAARTSPWLTSFAGTR